MEQGDWEYEKWGKIKDCKTDEIMSSEEAFEKLPFCFSLLWDQCKSCQENLGRDE